MPRNSSLDAKKLILRCQISSLDAKKLIIRCQETHYYLPRNWMSSLPCMFIFRQLSYTFDGHRTWQMPQHDAWSAMREGDRNFLACTQLLTNTYSPTGEGADLTHYICLRLLQDPPLPKANVLREGYQQNITRRGRRRLVVRLESVEGGVSKCWCLYPHVRVSYLSW